MGISDKKFLASNHATKSRMAISLVTAVSQTSAVAYSFTPGFTFRLSIARTYALLVAGTVTAVVKVGGRVAATCTFTSATDSLQTLSTTLANVQGSATEAITIEYTTNGSGALTNGFITLVFRARPMNGEAQ